MALLLISFTVQHTMGCITLKLLLYVPWHSLVLKKLHVHWKEVEKIPYFTSPNHNDRVKYKNTLNIKGSRKKLQITPITLKLAKWLWAVSDPLIKLQYDSIISEYAWDLTEFNVPVSGKKICNSLILDTCQVRLSLFSAGCRWKKTKLTSPQKYSMRLQA
jgi:hypothetical protein